MVGDLKWETTPIVFIFSWILLDCVQKALNSTNTTNGPQKVVFTLVHFLDLLTLRSFPTPGCRENL